MTDARTARMTPYHCTRATFISLCGYTAVKEEDFGGLVTVRTKCCNASGRVTSEGVVCRSCTQPVAAFYSEDGYTALVSAAEAAGCADPVECAHYALHRLGQE